MGIHLHVSENQHWTQNFFNKLRGIANVENVGETAGFDLDSSMLPKISKMFTLMYFFFSNH